VDHIETSIHASNIRFRFLVNLHKDVKCQDLETIRHPNWTEFSDSKTAFPVLSIPKVGFGYRETLIGCKYLNEPIPIFGGNFLILNIEFGDTLGVPESFGLFQKRMDFVEEKHAQFMKRVSYSGFKKPLKIIYYPTPESVGSENHRRLLMDFAERWATMGNNDRSMIVQVPQQLKNEKVDKSEFSVMTYIESRAFVTDYERFKWYSPNAPEAISTYFNSLILSHGKNMH